MTSVNNMQHVPSNGLFQYSMKFMHGSHVCTTVKTFLTKTNKYFFTKQYGMVLFLGITRNLYVGTNDLKIFGGITPNLNYWY